MWWKARLMMPWVEIVQWFSAGIRDGWSGFESRQGLGIFLFITASRPALGPTEPSTQWVPGALSLGVKRLEREADHSPPSSADVKECVELYIHFPSTLPWRGAQLKRSTTLTFDFNIRSLNEVFECERIFLTLLLLFLPKLQICVFKQQIIFGGWRKLRNKELHNFGCYLNTIRISDKEDYMD
jgi:hypothetical protein